MTTFPPSKPRIVAITQARTGSTRLPGKVLRVVAGKTLLEHHVDRLMRASRLDRVVVATTTAPPDDAIAALCASRKYPCVRGDEQDVLSRYALAARIHSADVIVRVTSDCPLIDSGVIDELVALFVAGELDYASVDTQSYPHGLDAEIFTRAALDAADAEAIDPAEREHVTPFLYRRPERFRLGTLRSAQSHPGHRWCVDEPRDLEFVTRVLEALCPERPDFTWRDCLAVVAQNPDWQAINRDVVQKKPGE
ncbi:MAG: glycosyltransferase family protein [Sphingomonadales bacterium]